MSGPRNSQWDSLILDAARAHGVDPALIKAHIAVESNFDPRAFHLDKDGKASYGLMQLRYDTARAVGYSGADPGPDPNAGDRTNLTGLYDPATNIGLGAKLIEENLSAADSAATAIAAYNEGMARARQDSPGPFRTFDPNYVGNVQAYWQTYKADFAPARALATAALAAADTSQISAQPLSEAPGQSPTGRLSMATTAGTVGSTEGNTAPADPIAGAVSPPPTGTVSMATAAGSAGSGAAATVHPTAFVHLGGANLRGTVLDNLDSGSPAQVFVTDTLNAALRARLISAANNAKQDALVSVLRGMPAVDIGANKDVSLKDFVTQHVTLPADPTAKAAAQAAISKLSTTTTLGELLGLNAQLKDSPLLAPEVQKADLGALLGTSPKLADAQLQSDFIERYANFKGSIKDFWPRLSQDPKFKDLVSEIQFTLQLGVLTLSNTSLVTALRTRFQPQSTRDLTKLSADDWTQLITSQKIAVPESIHGVTATERISNYVSGMLGVLKDAFPTDYIAQGITQSSAANQDPTQLAVSQFLKNSPDFNFLTTNIDSYAANNGERAFVGISADRRPAVINALKSYQRLSRVSTDFQVMSALAGSGLTSAYSIAMVPRSVFVQQRGGQLGGASQAGAIHATAEHIVASAVNLFANVQSALHGVAPMVVGDVANGAQAVLEKAGIPSWQTLFGSLSYCSCEDCRSVLSAAAYFVDLLQFLGHSCTPNDQQYTPLDILIGSADGKVIGRRPDLPYIKLNCENTTTPLPYVDLVNEILESFVVLGNGKLDDTAAHDTSKDATADQLSVNPEYTKDDAYTKLAAAVYPPTLPFDRWVETARIYLEFLGTSLAEVMKTFQVDGDLSHVTKGTPSGVALACERLGISELECSILTGWDFSGQVPPTPPVDRGKLWKYFGYTSSAGDGTVPCPSAGDSAAVAQKPWETCASQVPEFLKKTGITYDDLVALLETRFLNADQQIVLSAPSDAPCDLTQTKIVDLRVPAPAPASPGTMGGALQDATLDRMHRFIRLWKKLGWPMVNLDKAMTSLGATDIDQPLLVAVAHVHELQTALSAPIDELLSFWANIDADGRNSLWVQLFQNKAVVSPPDEAFQLTYSAPLPKVPTVSFPSPLFPNLVYDAAAQKLTYTLYSSLSVAELQHEKTQLLTLSSDAAYVTAINTLFTPLINAGVPPGTHSYSVGLAALPTATLPPYLVYDPGTHRVNFVGAMTDEQRGQLNFASDVAFQIAVDDLYEMRSLDGTAIANPSPLSDHTSAVSAALRIGVSDLDVLRKLTGLADTNMVVPTSVANLSKLFRYALLARGVGLSVSDLVALVALMGVGPQTAADLFANPAATLAFVKSVQEVRASQFIVAQLNYVYRDLDDPHAPVAPLPDNVTQFLAALQAGLATIAQDNAAVPDPKGAILRRKLATLVGSQTADAVVALINGAAVYSAPLALLPSIALPSFVTYDASAKQLNMAGAMSAAQQARLLGLSPETDYQAAVNALYIASQPGGTATYSVALATLPNVLDLFLSIPISYDSERQHLVLSGTVDAGQIAQLVALSTDSNYNTAIATLANNSATGSSSPPYMVSLGSLPAGMVLPDQLKGLVAYDQVAQQLRLTGPMTDGARATLLTLSSDASYQAAVQSLYKQPRDLIAQSLSSCLDPVDAATRLIESGWDAAAKISYVTQKLAPYLRQTLSGSLIKQTLSADLQLDPKLTDYLLNSHLTSQVYAGQSTVSPLTPAGDGLAASYFANLGLSGAPAVTRVDPSIDLDWSTMPPDPALALGKFSARWVGKVLAPKSEAYTFFVKAGDGVRLWVNGQLVIDQWKDQAFSEHSSATIALAAGQLSEVRLEYFNHQASAGVQLAWSSPSTLKAPIPTSQLYSRKTAMADFMALVGDGLATSYYSTNDLSGAAQLVRIDPVVDFDWGFNPPVSGLPAHGYSIQWTGYLLPRFSETHTFYVRAGDRARLWVNDQLLIDQKKDQPPTEQSATISLTAGRLVSVKMAYYNDGASGKVELRWSSPSTPKAIIPQGQLFTGSVFAISDGTFAPQSKSYELLYKIALLADAFHLSPGDVIYFSQHSGDFARFDLNALPLGRSDSLSGAIDANAPALFAQWQRQNAFVALRNGLPGGDGGLLNIFATASANASQGTLSDGTAEAIRVATGWDKGELGTLTSASGYSLTDADFQNELGTKGVGLVRLQSCVAMAARLGVPSKQLFVWANLATAAPDKRHDIAHDIVSTVKAKYDDATWVTVGKPLNDKVREESKEALVAYILANASAWGMTAADGGPITTSDQLYEYFLIDVEMSPCMMTSRIVQANAAIQLFVQRCLMNLEDRRDAAGREVGVAPSEIVATEWEWRKNYRIWQANREVFLYAENWVVPELRDGKTPFFQDLENELMQNEVNPDTVERAYRNYLTKLDEVARLDIRATFWQLDGDHAGTDAGAIRGTNDVLHVFGRTPAAPYVYYYRRLLNCSKYGRPGGGASWTPWERVDVDIQGDHLIPVVWNRRLYVFWPVFQEVPGESHTAADSGSPPPKTLKMTLAWSQYDQRKWSKKQVSPDALTPHLDTDRYDHYTVALDPNLFVFDGRVLQDDSLLINVLHTAFDVTSSTTPQLSLSQVGQFLFAGCNSSPSAIQGDGGAVADIVVPENSHFEYEFLSEFIPGNWPPAPPPGNWSSWASLGGGLIGDMAIGRNADGRLEAFVRGTDNALWHIWQTAPDGGWSGWASLGAPSFGPAQGITSNPAVGTNADGRLEVFVRGIDNGLWHIWQDPNGAGGWSGWASLGSPISVFVGGITSDPAVGVNADGRLEVFVRALDLALWHIWQTAPNDGWSGWASLGGGLLGSAAVGENADGRLEVFVRGMDSALWHIWQTAPNDGWSDWASLGGGLTSNIAVGRNADGRLEAFVSGTDNALWHIWQTAPNDGWSDWASLGGALTTNPAVTANGDGRLEVFVWGTDNALWHLWQDPNSVGGWSGWNWLGGVLTSDPAVGANADGRLEVFVRGTDNALWYVIGPYQYAYGHQLVLRTASSTSGGTPADVPTLGSTPTPFNLLFPQQYLPTLTIRPVQQSAGIPFFYEDAQRTYVVTEALPGAGEQVREANLATPVYSPAQLVAQPILSDVGTVPVFAMASSSAGAEATPAGGAYPVGTSVGASMTLSGTAFRTGNAFRAVTGSVSAWQAALTNSVQVTFSIHDHPHVCDFIKTLNWKGVPGLLTLTSQQADNTLSGANLFSTLYRPTSVVTTPYPKEDVDFSYGGAYSIYNWELFFHIPLLVATRLSQNQKFEEAQKWFHYIFNPTSSSPAPVPQRYWNCLPFYRCSASDEVEGQLEYLLRQLDTGGSAPPPECGIDVADQVFEWRANPFNPHLIARMRTIAYRKSVVMRYIDNLIAWGDYLFRQNTRESIYEAIQLYVLADEILGPRPTRIPPRGAIQDYTYHDLVTQFSLDELSNTLVLMENRFPFTATGVSGNGSNSGASSTASIATTSFYFCIPPDEQLLSYWDTVADRLFKIRHCMNIAGVVEQLPLFAPPISPALLVQAAAMGIDLGSVLNDVNAATPNYRFTTMLQKALELCSEVRSLGAGLLAALEKKDAEHLARLRAGQETSLLKAVKEVKQKQLDEANATLEGLQKSQELAQLRQSYYTTLLSAASTLSVSVPAAGASISIPLLPMNEFEVAHLLLMGLSLEAQAGQVAAEVLGAVLHLIPDFKLAMDGGATYGGSNVGSAIQAFGGSMGGVASILNTAGSAAATLGSYKRRAEEWDFQKRLASKELEQIDRQIKAANIRIDIAQKELDNQQMQIDNAAEVEDFLRTKFTNEQLYSWMVDRTSAVFFQCYQLAYETAKKAEKAFQFERGLTDSSYIQFGYWDSLKAGLQSGERLYLDMKRMEMAYLDFNNREYEITKNISLVLLDPLALIALKETGRCIVRLPEALVDMDYPGHYMRRLKSVSLTLPCVTGPYTSVNCTLTLLNSRIRVDAEASSPQDYGADAHFITNHAATQSIATSSAQNDSGMFEMNFRDERYLPFEGAGFISTWQIDLPQANNAFDFETISDLIITLRYTARDGGEGLRGIARRAAVLPAFPLQAGAVGGEAVPSQPTLTRLFSLKHEFPTEWYKFLNPADTATTQTMQVGLAMDRFPYQYRGKDIHISRVEVFLKFKDIHEPGTYRLDKDNPTPLGDYAAKAAPLAITLSPSTGSGATGKLTSTSTFLARTPFASLLLSSRPGLGAWQLVAKSDDIKTIAGTLQTVVTSGGTSYYHLKAEVIDDLLMVCHYEAT